MAWLNSEGKTLVDHQSLRNFNRSRTSGSGRFFNSSDCVRSQAWARAFFSFDKAERSSSSVIGSALTSMVWSFLPEAMNCFDFVGSSLEYGRVSAVAKCRVCSTVCAGLSSSSKGELDQSLCFQ